LANVKYPLLYCFVFVLFIACISCGKGGTIDDEPPHLIDVSDTTYPEVSVTTPTDNQAFTSGSVINVKGTVSDNSLYQGSVIIRNDATGAIVKEQYYEIHYIPSYNFNVPCTIAVNAATDYTVTVKFEDHGWNQTVKTVKIKVNP
jgi:hypothetical protein